MVKMQSRRERPFYRGISESRKVFQIPILQPSSSLKFELRVLNFFSGFRLFAVAARQANTNDIYPYNSV